MRHRIKISAVFHIIEASHNSVFKGSEFLGYFEMFRKFLEIFREFLEIFRAFSRISQKIFRPNLGIFVSELN